LEHPFAIVATDIDIAKGSLYLLPLALGNFAGPVLLGRFFDSIGRRQMISATYAVSGTLLVIAAINFRHSDAGALGQAVWFSVISFIASSAASSAYLTVSEIFPLEIRAFAISVFLRGRHSERRCRRAAVVRASHPDRLARRSVQGLCSGWVVHVGRRHS
jgi:MFS family permease